MNDTDEAIDGREELPKTFVEGIDFYFDEGLMVLTRKYLVDSGSCCGSGCRHCPYEQ